MLSGNRTSEFIKAGELVLTSCPLKNPPSLPLQSSLFLFSPSSVWSTLQQDDPFFCSCNTFSSPCACPRPSHWGLTLERPKPISSLHLLNSPYFSFLRILQSSPSSTFQNSMPSHTIYPMDPSSLIGQS